jgi:hypothetical protein
MNTRGSIAVGDLVGKVTMLEIACSRCDRAADRELCGPSPFYHQRNFTPGFCRRF